MSILPVILAGGIGSRLWPLSRELYPKQILNLTDDRSLLQNTLARVRSLPDILPPVIVVGEEHRFLAKSQAEELDLFPRIHVLLEPVGRNTAPAICGAALFAMRRYGEDTVLLVLPADHLIRGGERFADAVRRAADLAAQGRIVTFGVVPDRPETGYGYILGRRDGAVERFVEKPDLDTARRYLEDGNYFWNSGMFAFSCGHLVQELAEHRPEVLECMRRATDHGTEDGVFFRFNEEAMSACPDDSIDYALMEKTASAVVVPARFDWNDIGSWQALWEVAQHDEQGNFLHGDVMVEDVENSLIYSQSALVTALGLRDMVVVQTPDAVLVAPRSRSQEVKTIVKRLKALRRPEYSNHRKVCRPWGCYVTLEMQERFQIKRITVNPGAKLSLQKHYHRHEHWVVVSGTALVTKGEEEILLKEDQSVYIPLGTLHRLENPGRIPLEIIEVQLGSYLGEDDIVRAADVYGREDG